MYHCFGWVVTLNLTLSILVYILESNNPVPIEHAWWLWTNMALTFILGFIWTRCFGLVHLFYWCFPADFENMIFESSGHLLLICILLTSVIYCIQPSWEYECDFAYLCEYYVATSIGWINVGVMGLMCSCLWRVCAVCHDVDMLELAIITHERQVEQERLRNIRNMSNRSNRSNISMLNITTSRQYPTHSDTTTGHNFSGGNSGENITIASPSVSYTFVGTTAIPIGNANDKMRIREYVLSISMDTKSIAPENDIDCAICFESLIQPKQYADNIALETMFFCVLDCLHYYHTACLLQWIHKTSKTPACALCRKEIIPN